MQVRRLVEAGTSASAIHDMQAQSRDLIAALEETHAQRDELERLNEKLTETNDSVMALHPELTVEHKDVVERYSQEQELALTLQHPSFSRPCPSPPGVELAVRYLPAVTTTEIGGDFPAPAPCVRRGRPNSPREVEVLPGPTPVGRPRSRPTRPSRPRRCGCPSNRTGAPR